jgi:hypothetical protein
MRRSIRRLLPLVVFTLAFIPAACSSAGSSAIPGGTASPAASGDCQSAPAAPADQSGWTSASTAPTVFPVIVNSRLTCGANRLLFTFLDAQNQPVAKPDRTATISIYDLGRSGSSSVETETGTFVWGIDNVRGYYVANVSFHEAGTWGAEFKTAAGNAAAEMIRMTFEVATSTPAIRVGEAAPATDNPTAASVNGQLAMISSDANPDPAFYKTSVKAALAAHEPFVLVFATPKFCVSAQCGPTLDRIKPLAAQFPTVDFIHVEPYQLAYQNGSLQPVLDAQGNLQSIPAVLQWGILSEPWVFVVDRNGIVTASFEGVVSVDEITAAANAVK